MSEDKYLQYHKLENQSMTLRDYLAIDRTLLANERSFLSYIRTALTLVIAGVTLIKFFGEGITEILGWGLIVFGTLLFFSGAVRYETNEEVIKRINGQLSEAHADRSFKGRTKKFVRISKQVFRNFI